MQNSSEVLATDVITAPHLDRVINAEAMDFPDKSVKVIYGQNCFHHFPHPGRFFHELDHVNSRWWGPIVNHTMVLSLHFYTSAFSHGRL